MRELRFSTHRCSALRLHPSIFLLCSQLTELVAYMRVTQKALLLYLAVSDCNTSKSLPHSHWLANGDIRSTLQLVKQPVGSETIPSSCEVTCNSCEFMQTDNVVKEVWPVSIAHNVASFFCSRIHSYRISFPFHQQPNGWLVGHHEVKAYFGVQSLLKLQGYPLTASYNIYLLVC